MAKKYIVVSDLTGQAIEDDSQVAQVRVLSHPTIDEPVVLDAFALELQSLLNKDQELVTLELVLPDEDAPRQLLITLKEFDKLFKSDVDEVLQNAPLYAPQSLAPAPRRRGRPAGSASKSSAVRAKRDPELLNQIREWARENGYPNLGARGRIPIAAEEAWNAAHSS